jgi:hypothetical protein
VVGGLVVGGLVVVGVPGAVELGGADRWGAVVGGPAGRGM